MNTKEVKRKTIGDQIDAIDNSCLDCNLKRELIGEIIEIVNNQLERKKHNG